jgi:hypothetical protein
MKRKFAANDWHAFLLRAIRSVFALAMFMAVSGVGSRAGVAAYILVDDFQSYTTGNSNSGGSNAFTANGGPWRSRSDTGNITGSGLIQIQNDGSTNHLAFGWNAGTRAAYRAVPTIAEGDSAIYYFQIRSGDATPDMSYGLSDQAMATSAAFGDFEVQVALVDDGNGSNGLFKLVARPSSGLVDLATGLSVDTWYDIWLVVNNESDTYDVYFDTNVGDPNSLGALVGNDLTFRNGLASNDLVTFMTLDPPTGGNPADSQADLDDIYMQVIPEPSSMALAVLACLALMHRRK